MPNTFKAFKIITDPASLEPNALYLKRAGTGFDLTATTSDEYGSVVEIPLNASKKETDYTGSEIQSDYVYYLTVYTDASWEIRKVSKTTSTDDTKATGTSNAAGAWANKENEVYV
ncbi:MAG: hypothetical protein SWL02_09985 [Pseudomonadota bacterium]|nr:hypothetical protein [Pseudomonadota bacterium]